MSDPRWPDDGRDGRPDDGRDGRPDDGRDGRSDDPTRPTELDATQQLPSQPGAGRSNQPWEAEVPARTQDPGTSGQPGAYAPGDPAAVEPEPEPESRGKQIAIGVISGLLGFVLAFLVIAIFTGGDDGDPADPGLAASQERIEALEAELADRDLQIEELEARLAEAEAAAGEGDADIEAQREALDERAAALDQRADALDEREAALDEREAALDEREASIAEREQQAESDPEPSDPQPEPDADDDGITPPQIDEEEVENIVNRVLERLRELFN